MAECDSPLDAEYNIGGRAGGPCSSVWRFIQNAQYKAMEKMPMLIVHSLTPFKQHSMALASVFVVKRCVLSDKVRGSF